MIVLIVDDSKLARIVIKRAITNLRPSWCCLEAANFDEAVETLEAVIPDFAVIDYNMPGRNGLDLAEVLLSKYPHLLAVIATANIQADIIKRTEEIGATFLAKPVSEESLRPILPQEI